MPNSIKEIPARFCAWWAGYWNAVTSAFRGMSKDNLTMIASGMVYSTLIAIVPCLTFLFAFLSAFGVLQYASSLNTSSYVYLWSSTPASGANASYLQVARGAGAGINTWNKGAKAAGYPVRCVKVE